MAKKKPDISDLFSTQQPQAEQPAAPRPEGESIDAIDIPATGRTLPTGVGLKQSELDLYDQLAQELGASRNKVMRYALRYFLKAYYAGAASLTAGDLLQMD